MIRTLIIDEEEKERETLKSSINKFFPGIQVVDSTPSLEKGIEIIKKEKPELLFLDVAMPFENYFKSLEKHPEIDFEIVFMSASESWTKKAVKHNALDFILKPVNLHELNEAVQKAIKKIERKRNSNLSIHRQNNKINSKIGVPTTEGIVFININDIVHCMADVNYTRIFLNNGEKIIVSKTLKDFDELLNNHNFYRIHNSSLVNLNHVSKYVKGEGGYIHTLDGTVLEVSRRKKAGLLECFILLANVKNL